MTAPEFVEQEVSMLPRSRVPSNTTPPAAPSTNPPVVAPVDDAPDSKRGAGEGQRDWVVYVHDVEEDMVEVLVMFMENKRNGGGTIRRHDWNPATRTLTVCFEQKQGVSAYLDGK